MVMAQIVKDLLRERAPKTGHVVTHEQYQQWAAGFVFEALRDQRYGQSFCRKFDITDNILYYASSVSDADRYIRENYVR